jgi:hypothetical protein
MDPARVRASREHKKVRHPDDWSMLIAPVLGEGTAVCARSARKILNMRVRCQFVPFDVSPGATPGGGTPVQISTTPKGLSNVKARAGALSQVSDGFTFAPLVLGPLRVRWTFAHRRIMAIYDIVIL